MFYKKELKSLRDQNEWARDCISRYSRENKRLVHAKIELNRLLDRYEAETLTKAHKTAMLTEAREILKNSGCEEKEEENEGAQQ